jgi:hypothetical protein
MLNLGDHYLELTPSVDATTKLAEVVERVRARHLARVSREADAAMRRRFRLPEEP